MAAGKLYDKNSNVAIILSREVEHGIVSTEKNLDFCYKFTLFKFILK